MQVEKVLDHRDPVDEETGEYQPREYKAAQHITGTIVVALVVWDRCVLMQVKVMF